MGIYLGNLSVKQMQDRLGITLNEQDFKELDSMRERVIDNVSADQMHIYDMPFMVYCGSYDTAVKVRDILSPYGKHMTGTVSIGIREQAVPK